MLSSWRALYRLLQDRDPAMKENPCAGLKAPKAAKRLPSALSPDEAVRLVEIPGDEPLAVRDRALFELAYSSGLRLSELAVARCGSRRSRDGRSARLGQGREGADRSGRRARRSRRSARGSPVRAGHARTPIPKAMFVGRSGKRITPRAIERRLAEWAVRQGLSRHVHPHMLRHSFASHVLQSSGDLRAVQEMLGHASIASTQVYTHLDFQYLAKAYDQRAPARQAQEA